MEYTYTKKLFILIWNSNLTGNLEILFVKSANTQLKPFETLPLLATFRLSFY